MMSFYVRATGNNRFMGGGTSNWLKIRGIIKEKHGFEIKVRVNDRTSYIVTNKNPKYLQFGQGWPGLMPISFDTVLRRFKNGSAK